MKNSILGLLLLIGLQIVGFKSEALDLSKVTDLADQSINPEENPSAFYDQQMKLLKSNLGKMCLIQSDEDFLKYQVEHKSNDADLDEANPAVIQAMEYVDYPLAADYKPQKDNCYLTKDEMSALQYYTGSGYVEINSSLRTANLLTLKNKKIIIKFLISALNKIANFEGLVKRGTNIKFAALSLDHVAGNTVKYMSFLSTSIADGFGGTVRYLIKSKTCKYIAALSTHPGEEEVLCLPGTQFKIIYSEIKDNTFRIYMEEVAQEFDINQYIAETEKKQNAIQIDSVQAQ